MFPSESSSCSSECRPPVKMVDLDRMERMIKGKAALGLKKFNDFKEKVRVEAMEMKLNESDEIKKSKELHGGWILTKVSLPANRFA